MDDITPYCTPYADAHATFRAFLLAHPDADVTWTVAADGTTDVLMTDQTERTFRRWHHAQQAAAIVPLRGALWMAAAGLEPWGGPPA